MLQAVARILDGQVPYRDFWWFYPPGQPYLLAALEAVTGPSLLTWRVVRVLADATVALLAWRLARRAGASAGWALGAWLVAILAMAYPSGPHPFPLALAFALGALLCADERPALAGALAGACALWRLEFAVALLAGLTLGALVARGGARAKTGAGRLGRLGRLWAIAALVAALLYLPVVASAGPRRAWELLVAYPLTEFRDYQALPFPLVYDGPLNTSSLGGFLADTIEPALLFYLPLALVLGLAGSLVALVLGPGRRDELRVATAVLALGMLAYLLSRADLFHTAPLAVLVAVLAASCAREGPRLAAVVAVGALLYAAVEGLDRRWLALREETVPLELAVADGVRVAPGHARALAATVAAVQARVPAGTPLYVATRRADLVTAGHPLLYVLAGRANPSPYDIQAPGVVTSAGVQREIVAALERSRPPVVVRWADPVTAAPEPNAAGRSSGVRLLDDYLAREYVLDERFGDFLLLARKG